jgi:RNA polymerase sigma factor for flagellar operon FliA
MLGARLAWGNREAQEALARYEVVVRAVARRLAPAARFGHALDEEDLCAEGRVAVLEALRTYAGFGIEERTWVRTRIRQRMIDAIRRLDVRTRDEVRKGNERERARTEGNDQALPPETAVRRLVSLDTMYGDAEPASVTLSDASIVSADDVVEQNAQNSRLLDAIRVLPPRQRRAIELGLFEGLALREIGDRMGISESRVCQLQKRAVQHLQRAVSCASSDAQREQNAA